MFKILFIAYKHEYGKPELGFSLEYYNFYNALVNMNQKSNNVIYFPLDEVAKDIGYERMNQKFLEIVRQEKPDICFFVLSSGFLEKETVKKITEFDKIITLNWFTDDHWKFDNFSKHWASLFNWAITTDFNAFLKYKKIGYKNIIKSQWGFNHFLYKHMDLSKIYDVSFVGQPHGNRKQIIKKLKNAGIKVKCFGKGWAEGRVSQQRMIEIFSQSKINLNFAKSSGRISLNHIAKIFFGKRVDKTITIDSPKNWVDNIESLRLAIKNKQIKGRNFEITGCGGFLLTEYVKGLEEYYKIGKEIACYKDVNELINKIKYFLKHSEERENIAMAGRKRVLDDHTYERRFNKIFEMINVTNNMVK